MDPKALFLKSKVISKMKRNIKIVCLCFIRRAIVALRQSMLGVFEERAEGKKVVRDKIREIAGIRSLHCCGVTIRLWLLF
jgi:hypothetical protein